MQVFERASKLLLLTVFKSDTYACCVCVCL